MVNEGGSTAAAVCGACGKEASFKCTACGLIYYCSKEHQKKHWKLHKSECSPMKEEFDPQRGRYLVAGRNIEEGQLLLSEKPLALGPPSKSPGICLGCHQLMTGEVFKRCPKCFWPMCSLECTKSKQHKVECAHLSTDVNQVGPPPFLGLTPRYDVILLLRILSLRSSNPEGWELVQKLVSHTEKFKEAKEVHHMTAVKYISEFLNNVCDADTVHQIRGAVITNAINIKGPQYQDLRGIYPKIALLNHSCNPNVTLRSDANGTLYINASCDVKKGDPLVFSYISPSTPLWERQQELQYVYNFDCDCKRCTDPTEMNTYFSSPKCVACTDGGFLLPDGKYDNPWKCSKCEQTKSMEEISKEAEEFIENFKEKVSTATNYTALMQEVSHKYHTKHYVWLSATNSILEKVANLTDMDSLSIKRDLWTEMAKLMFKLEPGTTRRRGVTLFNSAYSEFELRKAENAEGKYSKIAYISLLTNVLYNLKIAKEILDLEPADSLEKKWIIAAEDQIKVVSNMIDKLEQ